MQAFEVEPNSELLQRESPPSKGWQRAGAAAALVCGALLLLASTGTLGLPKQSQGELEADDGGSFLARGSVEPNASSMTTNASSCVEVAAEFSKQLLDGRYVPTCDADGSFSARQCHASTGFCWCADKQGYVVNGTRGIPGPTKEACEAYRRPASADCHAAAAKHNQTRLIGAYIPQCEADGSFSALQCHGSIGHCWCADEQGQEINGTRSRPGPTTRECQAHRLGAGTWAANQTANRTANQTVSQTSCMSEQEAGKLAPRPGRFVPSCDADGSYSSLQCHASTGYCWCADAEGRKVDGTEARLGPTKETCDLHRTQLNMTDCQATRAKQNASGLLGSFVPRCEDDGSFSPLQCHSSTGHCWCADQQGSEIDGTRGRPGPSSADCQAKRQASDGQTTCASARALAIARARPGAFVPQCEQDGSYKSRQCHASTGVCWCADSHGHKLPSPTGPTDEECQRVVRAARAQEECGTESMPCTPELQRQGVNCVVGACVQVQLMF